MTTISLNNQSGVRKYDTAKRYRVKVRPSHQQNYDLYKKFSTMTKPWPCKNVSDPNGYTPLECFVHFDSHGQWLPCTDAEELHLILHGKEMINLQIKMWVDGILEGSFYLFEIEEHCQTENYPDWVVASVVRQVVKRQRSI